MFAVIPQVEWSDSAPGVTVLLVAGEAWTTGCQVVVLVVLVEVVLLVVVLVVVVTKGNPNQRNWRQSVD